MPAARTAPAVPGAADLAALVEPGAQYGYRYDGWAEGPVLHYTGEGQKGDQRFIDGNRAIRDHRAQGRALRVFRARPPFATYLGEFQVAEDEPAIWADALDIDRVLRQVIVFRLRPVGAFELGDLLQAAPVGPGVEEDVPADAQAPLVADVAVEENSTGSFVVEPGAESVEYQRREAALVERYKSWLRSQGHEYGRKRITVPGQAGRLYTDLHDHALNEMIEAKASASRVSVRTGLGQLLDYARFVHHESRALLLPARPRPDLIDLLHQHGCGCTWETKAGEFERAPASSPGST